jgi:hypothetical protein
VKVTKKERKELRDLYEASTQGEWVTLTGNIPGLPEEQVVVTHTERLIEGKEAKAGIAVTGSTEGEDVEESFHNANFIASAHEAFPRLLDYIDSLEAKVKELRSSYY